MRFIILERCILAHNVEADSEEEAKKIVERGKSKGVFQSSEGFIACLWSVVKKEDSG